MTLKIAHLNQKW